MSESAATKQFHCLQEILDERQHQNVLKAHGKFRNTCADEIHPCAKLAILVEEVGEISRVLNEDLGANELRKELTQVAAICLAWLESLS